MHARAPTHKHTYKHKSRGDKEEGRDNVVAVFFRFKNPFDLFANYASYPKFADFTGFYRIPLKLCQLHPLYEFICSSTCNSLLDGNRVIAGIARCAVKQLIPLKL